MQKRKIDGQIFFLGFGCVGSSLLPFIMKYWQFDLNQITILDKDDKNFYIAKSYGIKNFLLVEITKKNYKKYLTLDKGDILINLSVDIGSKDLVALCDEKEVLYIDTCIEPWAGVYDNPDLTPLERSNYQLRKDFLGLQKKNDVTALTCHGANPGLVSHFVKQALINMAKKANLNINKPQTQEEWALLAYKLNIKTIHIAERDTQETNLKRQKEQFFNTWSVDGMISEGLQPAEMGFGSHETWKPAKSEIVENGNSRALIMHQMGATVKVQTYVPSVGRFMGMVITHNEAHSISEYFSTQVKENKYSPTVHYAYHPTNVTIESWNDLLGTGLKGEDIEGIVLKPENIENGTDALTVLLMGNEELGAYSFGSHLSIEQAKNLIEYNTATSLQIAISARLFLRRFSTEYRRCAA